jgi:hypothetical protein
MRAGPVWQFTVGARSAARDTSWGTSLDLNGDGYSDGAVGAPGAVGSTGRVTLFLGSPSGLNAMPTLTLTGTGPAGGFGAAVASAGDVNGDGYGDLIVGAWSLDSSTGRAYVYFGAPSGPTSAPSWSVAGPDGASSSFGIAVSSAGDVNGDGYADLIVGASTAAARVGRAHVFYGGPMGPSLVPDWSFTGPDGAGSQFGASVAYAGDSNGDGYGDIVIGAYGAGPTLSGRAYFFFGGSSGLASTPDASMPSIDGAYSQFGHTVASAGDVDGDGFTDIIVGADGVTTSTGSAFLFNGGASGPSPTPARLMHGTDGTLSYFGASVAGIGDVDGDGFSDVAVGAYGAMSSTGRVYVYLGGSGGLAASPAVTLPGRDSSNGHFGQSVATVGDSTGDGFADVFVGASGAATGAGRAYLFLGSAAGLLTMPTSSLTGGDANGGFGSSLAL